MIICSAFLVNFLSQHFARAITVFPFILLKDKSLKNDRVLLNHEKIHWYQQLETGIFLFYLWYLASYFYSRSKGLSHYESYRHISFEQEAFDNESNLYYLKKRRLWAFIHWV